ncbi:MAG: deoxyribodipyrimidine photo-lyase, partial [Bacilli bacterium]|nr:deoxyribodipyrimidine photo-lyase [Bacilli bacterium]
MNKNRIEIIKTAELSIDKGEYVLYWMQQSMRVNYNHALNYAIERANESFLPVLVYFTIDTAFPYINKRSLFFMLEGLEEVKEELTNKGINFIIEIGNVKDTINKYLKHTMLLITDKGYLRYQKSIREECFGLIDKNYPNIRIVMIDQDVIVPVNIVSQKVEYGAYTIRPKITKMYLDYLDFHNLKEVENKTKLNYQNIDIKFLYSVINVDDSVFKSEVYIGGYSQAKKILYDFINN